MKLKSLILIKIFGICLSLCLANAAQTKNVLFALSDESGSHQLSMQTVERNNQQLVPLKEFCSKMKCTYFYQWENFRAFIKNPMNTKMSPAIVSSIANIAVSDGNVIDFSGEVVSDSKLGYLIPLELAQKLALSMRLGRIEAVDQVKTTEAEQPKTQNAKKKKINKIVIDPGHGGTDLGTIHGYLNEKDISLVYAMKLKEEIEKEIPDLEVEITRTGDTFVSLQDRAKFANDKQADFFLSLHVNHAEKIHVHGTETYILNPNATDDEAKKTAMLENDSWLKSIRAKDPKTNNDVLMKILADVELTKYIQESALMASYLQQEFASDAAGSGLKNRGVKQAMFFVLSQVSMPSVLVEMGFLSNENDRNRLMNVVFRDQFVRKIVSAIKKYRSK